MSSVLKPYEHYLSSAHFDETDDDIQTLLDEIQSYQIQTNIKQNEVPDDNISTDNGIVKYFEQLCETSATEGVACGSCTKQVRVEYMSSIKRGDHISISGRVGRKHKFGQQIKFYFHHAIVKNVTKIEKANKKALVELYHFWHDENKTLSIINTTETFDLSKDEINIIQYLRPKYDSEDIVRRAESIVGKKYSGIFGIDSEFKNYNFITKNCEHFASWCVIGDEECFQVRFAREAVVSILSVIFPKGCMIVRFIKKLLLVSPDDLAARITSNVNIPTTILAGFGGAYLLYCIIMTLWYRKQRECGLMCQNCFTRNWKELWLNFSIFAGVSVLSLLMVHLALPLLAPGVGIPIFVLLILVAAGLQCTAVKLWKKLQSPFRCSKTLVLELKELQPGDVIACTIDSTIFKRKTVIVADVDLEKSEITGIYYSRKQKSIVRRTIIEKKISIDLKNHPVHLFNLDHLKTYPRDVVLRRARLRLGEEKWSRLSNSSEHFCFWAKVISTMEVDDMHCDTSTIASESENLDDSTLFVGTTEVHSVEQIYAGAALLIKPHLLEISHIFKRYCIVVRVRQETSNNDRMCKIDAVMYGRCFVTEMKENIDIDLNVDKVSIVKYHPAHCQTEHERIRRAKEINRLRKHFFTGFRFIEACLILKSAEWTNVHDSDDIQPGDAVFCKEPGIVVSVSRSHEDSGPAVLEMIVYRYWRPKAVRRIVDLSKDNVRVKKYASGVSPSRETSLARAVSMKECSKLGRRWTKNGFIQECTCFKSDGRVSVFLLEELQPGDIVEYKGVGILIGLTELNENGKEFVIQRIIYNKQNQKASEESHLINLTTDTLFVRKYNSSETYSLTERMIRALAVKDKTIPDWTDMEFIRDCIILKQDGNRLVHSLKELRPGDVLEHPVRGIIIEIRVTDNCGKKCDMMLISCKKSEVRPITESYDLQKETLIEKRYHLSQCCDREARKARAIAKVGKQYSRWSEKGVIMQGVALMIRHVSGSWSQNGFIEECVIPQKSQVYQICHLEEVHTGDVIIDMDNRNMGVLVKKHVISIDKKQMSIIYIVNGIRVTKMLDLRYDSLCVKRYDNSKCYSKKCCVKRAKAMEQKQSQSSCWTQEQFVKACVLLPNKGTVAAFIYEDINLGDVVTFKKFSVHVDDLKKRDFSGIVVGLRQRKTYSYTEFDIELVKHDGDHVISKKAYEKVSLRKEQMSVENYSGEQYFEKNERVRRALAIANIYTESEEITQEELIESCIESRGYGRKSFRETLTQLSKSRRKRIYMAEDIFTGDVIEIEGEKGIVVETTKNNNEKVVIEVVVCKNGKLMKKIYDIKFAEQKIYIKIFRPESTFSLEKRVERAKSLFDQAVKGQKIDNFIRKCIELIN